MRGKNRRRLRGTFYNCQITKLSVLKAAHAKTIDLTEVVHVAVGTLKGQAVAEGSAVLCTAQVEAVAVADSVEQRASAVVEEASGMKF